MARPLFDIVADFTAGPPNLPGASMVSLNSQGTATQAWGIRRGRQYELGNAEAGALTLDAFDPKENLNPINTGSPWNSGGNTLLPYRCVQVGAWWNTATQDVTGNLLANANPMPGQPTLAYAYGYDPSFEQPYLHTGVTGGATTTPVASPLPSGPLNSNTGFESGISPWAVAGGTVAQSSTQKHTGSFAAKITPNGTSNPVFIESEQIAVVAGNNYAASAWVWFTSAVSGNYSTSINWYTSAHAYITTSNNLVSVAANTWTLVTSQFTAPAGAAFGTLVPALFGTPAVGQIWYVDDATFTNATNPADSTYAVTAVTLNTAGDFDAWSPRYVPGQTYQWTMDVYAAVGTTIKLAWTGQTPVNTTVAGTNTYQSVSLTWTAGAADTGAALTLGATVAASYPTTIYYANWGLTGLMPGWTQTSGSSMRYSQLVAHSGAYSNTTTLAATSDHMTLPLRTVPRVTYTFSAWMYSTTVSATTTMTIGTATQTQSTLNTWQRFSITFIATAAVTNVTWTGSLAGTIVTVDDLQLEIGATASTYTGSSGPRYFPRYTGYIERYPQTWVDAGFRGMKPLEGVDALSVLSRTVINQTYASTILADNPTVYIPYTDSAPPTTIQLPQGGQPGIGYTFLGNSSSSVNFQGDSFLDGSAALAVVQQNANPAVGGDNTYITYAGTRNLSVTMNPQLSTLEFWVKPTSGAVWMGAGAVPSTENPNTDVAGTAYYLGLYTSAGKLLGKYSDPAGGGYLNGLPGWSGYPDGQWHYVALVQVGSSQFHFYVDGVAGGTGTMSGSLSQAVLLNNFYVESTTYYGDPVTQVSVANLAFYPAILTDAKLAAHYKRGIGYLNELSGARVARLLNLYWSTTNYSVAPGNTLLAPDFNYDPAGSPQSARTMLDVLQEISSTENSLLWVNTAGKVVWEDRSTRAALQTSTATLGTGAGQIHFEDLQYDYDPTYVYSQVNLTRPANSNYPPQTNPTSLAAYGQRILSVTLQVNSDFDLAQAATFYLNRYAAPGGAPGTGTAPRIRKITLNPSADPSMWTFILGLDLSQRLTVTFKTSAGVTITGDYYVEYIAESHNPADITHSVDLQLSPVFVPTAWVLGDSTYGVLGTTTVPVY